MVSLAELQQAFDSGLVLEYQCQSNLNLYASAAIDSLATQAVSGRQLRFLPLPPEHESKVKGMALRVCLCEDDYPGWLPLEDIDLLEVAEAEYSAISLLESEIQARLPQVIAYTHTAMAQPNRYLWGGTVGPNYDCSGLVQTAFAAAGIWLPRDAYQQAAFTQPIDWSELQAGDLIFFSTDDRITHVALALGEGYYIHSSGKDQGRNGIGIDSLSQLDDPISLAYANQICSAGRVVRCYQPLGTPWSRSDPR